MENAEKIFREKLMLEGMNLPESNQKLLVVDSDNIIDSSKSVFLKNISPEKLTNYRNVIDQMNEDSYTDHLDNDLFLNFLPEDYKIMSLISKGNISNYIWRKGNTNLVEFLDSKIKHEDIKYALDFTNSTEVYFTCLSWYKNTMFIKLTDETWKIENLNIYYILQDGELLHRLDGTSPVLHKLNVEIPIHLNASNVMDYLKFFCFFVRGEQGPFYVLDNPEDPYLPNDINLNKVIRNVIHETFLSKSDENNEYFTKVLIYYSDALFEAQFKIKDSGMVDMVDDEPVVANLSTKIEQPIK